MECTEFTGDEAEELFHIASTIAECAAKRYAEKAPRASSWTDVWCELRQAVGHRPPDSWKHLSFLVLMKRNNKTRKIEERILFRGNGDCPTCTAHDLLGQLREEINSIRARGIGVVPAGSFLTTVLGHNAPAGVA